MERPDFFTLKNGEKAKLPFSNEEYNQRLNKLRSIMDKDNLDIKYITGKDYIKNRRISLVRIRDFRRCILVADVTPNAVN